MTYFVQTSGIVLLIIEVHKCTFILLPIPLRQVKSKMRKRIIQLVKHKEYKYLLLYIPMYHEIEVRKVHSRHEVC